MQSDYIKPNREERLEKLKQDFKTPFSPPDDEDNHMPTDYPARDATIDSTEWYQEGFAETSAAQSSRQLKRDSLPPGFIQDK